MFTIDVEVWCDGWTDVDARFPAAFQRYIHGSTPSGAFGLPFQLDVLRDHGLAAVCFLETLYAARFGLGPLAETVALVREAGHEIQLHLHPEWADEAHDPILVGHTIKRQHLRQYSLKEQRTLIDAGRTLLQQAGGPAPAAFRAGSFGFNRNTLVALRELGIPMDSSYNASRFGLDSGVFDGMAIVEPVICEGVTEVPITTFRDGTSTLRHAQLTACSYGELEALLYRAADEDRGVFVLLSHGSELLNTAKNRGDDIAVQRFRRLCTLLDRRRDLFRTVGFNDLNIRAIDRPSAPPLTSPIWRTGLRVAEQAYRRRFG